MNKAKLSILGKIFERETQNLLPWQPPRETKLLSQMVTDGLIVPMVVVLGPRTRFPVRVTGWQLTERGRMEWCQSCK